MASQTRSSGERAISGKRSEDTGRTIGQAAIQFVLDSPAVAAVLPNVYDAEQLAEFVDASDTPPLSEDEISRIADLYERNFDLAPVAATGS